MMQELTQDYLKTLSIDELEKLKEEYIFKKDKEDLMQYVVKILLNSYYGAASMESATFSHGKGYASSVTSTGRFMNRWVAYTVSKKIAAMLKIDFTDKELDNIPYLIQADTDSCVYNTIINTTKYQNIMIGDYFDKIQGTVEIRDENNLIKHITEYDTINSVSKDFNMQDKKINYVMKHKVKKRLFKITVNSESTTITEDHSLMVRRDNELVSVKVSELLPTDEVLLG